MQALAKTKAGESCTIKWMFGNPEILAFLRDHEIGEGTTVTVIKNSAGSLIIGKGRLRLAMSGEIAERIQV